MASAYFRTHQLDPTKKLLAACRRHTLLQGSLRCYLSTMATNRENLFEEVCSKDFLNFKFGGRGYQV